MPIGMPITVKNATTATRGTTIQKITAAPAASPGRAPSRPAISESWRPPSAVQPSATRTRRSVMPSQPTNETAAETRPNSAPIAAPLRSTTLPAIVAPSA